MKNNKLHDLLDIILNRYSARKSTVLTSNRPIEDWGKLLKDNASKRKPKIDPPLGSFGGDVLFHLSSLVFFWNQGGGFSSLLNPATVGNYLFRLLHQERPDRRLPARLR
jgi:hypothetical protein